MTDPSRHNKYQRPTPDEPEHLTCEVCLKEIPSSVSHSAEAGDYVHHFCGIECMDRWKAKEQADEGPNPGDVRPDV